MGNDLPAAYDARIIDEIPFAGTQGTEPVRIAVPGTVGGTPAMQIEVMPHGGVPWFAQAEGYATRTRGAVTGLYRTPDALTVCAIVSGQAYLIEVTSPMAHQAIDTGGPVIAVRAVLGAMSQLLLATPWRITAVGATGVLWRTGRLAIEWLRMDEVLDARLAGVADPDDEEPHDFAVDLRTGEHEGGAPLD
jgi:hypothetical protein